ncbi:PLP-dependent transferase [bacterium]|nr:PLP-dependent transferase [bacterium]NBX81952.1 PLP-dependent transferase [bacterium]
MESQDLAFETLSVHAGVQPDPSTGAIMTPIFATSTYVQTTPGKHLGYDYSRTSNPTRTALEGSIAALEGAEHCLALSSGCTGTDILCHTLEAGDHIVSVDDVYGGTSRLFRTVWARHGVETTFADLAQHDLAAFIRPKTKMIWIETPTNPLLKIIDIERVVKQARQLNPKPLVVVDNTFASPYFQRPLELGADVVLHSTTKYLNGHSDVVGGALAFNGSELRQKLHHIQNSMGGVPGPFDAWLVLRGIKTLALRMKRHEENAMELASWLEKHPKIEKVLYPGLKSHPQHEIAKRQMKGFGGMITFFLKGNLDVARNFLERVRLFALAESLGGVESLIEHPAIMTHASIPAEMRAKLGITDTLARISTGIENVQDLRKDLEQALK